MQIGNKGTNAFNPGEIKGDEFLLLCLGGTMKKTILLSVIALLLFSTQVFAQDVPLEHQVKLMLKIISMDRNFDRFGDPVKIGVSSDEMLKEVSALVGKMKLKGKEFVVEKMNSVDDVANYKVAYAGSNWASQYSAVSAKAASNQCLIFCQTEEGVLSGGCSVSFKVVDNSPKIVVNLENAKKQGTDFPAGFLQITVVVGGLK